MRYLSVCSGIEAATVAWHPLGWTAAAYSEIEKFPSQVLAHHYPDVPNVGDMTKFKEWTNVSNVDVLVGGTPCQSFSVAGLRKGLDDPRGNLMLTYLAIATKFRPKWLVWENVPGVLSSNGGLDFASLLRGMGECGYGFAYRILDAQYFGVAQRRKRVFVVGCLGDWRAAAAVLFERHSLSGYPAPSREKREIIAASIGDGAQVGSLCARTGLSISVQDAGQGHLLPIALQDITSREKAQNGKGWNADGSAYTVDTHATQGVAQPIPLGYSIREDAKANTFSATELNVSTALKALQPGVQSHHAQTFVAQPIAFSRNDDGRDATCDLAPTMRVAGNAGGMLGVAAPCFPISTQNALGRVNGRDDWPLGLGNDGDPAPTLTKSHGQGVALGMAVRRLTPVEFERLQGFPDNYTNIKDKCPDGPRYKALGNSMAVPVMAWIGKRIQEVENIK